MDKEAGREFLTRVIDYLVSLPFDLKILQEAIADPELEPAARELAASVVIHVFSPREGTGAERFLEDVFLFRLALQEVCALGGDGAGAFRARFPEAYERLDSDLATFQGVLGEELWRWLGAKLPGLGRLTFKGKRPARYVEDEDAQATLYEDGLDFQTAYNLSEDHARNRLRRPEQVTEILQRRHSEEAKKRGASL